MNSKVVALLRDLNGAEELMRQASDLLSYVNHKRVTCPKCGEEEMGLNINNSDCTLLPFGKKFQITYNWYCGSCGAERDFLSEEEALQNVK